MTKPGKLLEMAKTMAAAVEAKAVEIDVPMVVAIVDMGGNLVLVHRMEDSLLASIDVAIDKAYTSASLKLTSEFVGTVCKEGGPLYGLDNCCGGRIVAFGGGFPIYENGKPIGAIGVSGGSVEEDMLCAQAGLALFAEKIEA